MAENTEKILYQLYKPKLKECATFALHIGISSPITCCLTKLYRRYSVTVCYNYGSGKKKEYLTSKIWAPWSARPNWNEDFTFPIIMKNASSVYKNYTFEFKLKAIPCLGPAYEVATGTFTLHEIFDKQHVELTGGIKINVKFTEGEKRDPDVRIRDQDKLCEEEVSFCNERRNTIHKSAVYNKIPNIQESDPKDVPNIAVIGSGGGMRAVQGMCGAMIALEELHILDLAMYTAGVSGSSWYISTLYTEDKDKLNPTGVKESIKNNVASKWEEGVSALKSLKTAIIRQFSHTGKYRTFTNVFGNAIGDILLKKKKHLKWSSQTKKLEKANVPLPLLAMLHVFDKENLEESNEWIECSPYEVFMPKYGTGIDMKHFGSEFDGGFITKEYPEEPVHFLQGVCGSAYISVLNPKPKDNRDNCCFRKGQLTYYLESYLMETMETKCVGEIPNWLYNVSEINNVYTDEEISREDISEDDIISMKKVIADISKIQVSKDDESRITKFIKLFESKSAYLQINLKEKKEDITLMQNIFKEISRENISNVDIDRTKKVLEKIELIGIDNLKKPNKYLTKGEFNSMTTFIDRHKEELMLTDAGIEFNSPYPLVLHPARKIDLILSFEFSAPGDMSEWPFSELRKAEKWAKSRNIPFPDISKVDEYKKKAIDTLYVFEGEMLKTPTIMHFVMYKKSEDETRRTCESKVEDMYFRDYKTMKFWYSNEEFNWLSKLMETIVQNKKDEINQEIAQAVKNKKFAQTVKSNQAITQP